MRLWMGPRARETSSGGRRLADAFVEGAAREGRPGEEGGDWRMRLRFTQGGVGAECGGGGGMQHLPLRNTLPDPLQLGGSQNRPSRFSGKTNRPTTVSWVVPFPSAVVRTASMMSPLYLYSYEVTRTSIVTRVFGM